MKSQWPSVSQTGGLPPGGPVQFIYMDHGLFRSDPGPPAETCTAANFSKELDRRCKV